MPVLPNARHERFAQGLASGLTGEAAYAAAGFKANRGNAATLKSKQAIANRVAELTQCGADAVIETLTAKQRVARLAYERIEASLPSFVPESGADLKAIGDLALAIDKDERLALGGANPDQPNITINVVSVEVDDVFRRVRPASPMVVEHDESAGKPGNPTS